MKGLKTVTEYQLLHLARNELLRRLDRISKKSTMSRRDTALYRLYDEQVSEINDRMSEIENTTKEEEDEAVSQWLGSRPDGESPEAD